MKLIVSLFILYQLATSIICFENITHVAFQGGNNGILAAFGDFNSDKTIDLFQIVDNHRAIEVLLAYIEEPYFRNSSIRCNVTQDIINVVPGDFNGDSMMDILVTTKNSSDKINVHVFWGSIDSIECDATILATISDQPVILDYNGDMIVDFLGQTDDGNITIWLGTTTKAFVTRKLSDGTNPKLLKPHSSAFVDLNGDRVADIFLTTEAGIECWINKNGRYEKALNTISYPTNKKHLGQISFIDINSDGTLDMIYPVCVDEKCSSSQILGYNRITGNWEEIASHFSSGNQTWNFIPPTDKYKEMLQINLKSADLDMNGYPDFVTILQNKDDGLKRAVLFKNEPCDNCFLKRTLVPKWDSPMFNNLKDVQLVAFYDILDDGKIDLLAVTNTEGKWKTSVLRNTEKYDACFIKVLVISGRCYSDCPKDLLPYGTNQPGPIISYQTQKTNGEIQTCVSGQLSQSAYFSLQLPYVLFGLGQTPNFVESLTVSLPTNSSTNRTRKWTQIIPNSQLVVVPYPPDDSQRWVNKLFVTPSHLVIVSGIALLGSCGFITIIIGLLHLKEKREDRREKLQEAHRFHFDAM